MGAPAGRAPRAALLTVVAVVVLTDVALLTPVPAGWDATLVTNSVAVVTPAVAAGCGWWRAARSTGRRRQAWTALAAAVTCWAVGDTVWAVLEATGRQPFPSVADGAYLLFGPLVCLGLVRWPVGHDHGSRLLSVLDGIATSGALLIISWRTALGAAVQDAGPQELLASAVSVAYPLFDVAVAVLAIITLARAPARSGRVPLAVLATGLVTLSLADSWFVHLAATGTYRPGDLIDLVWNAGVGCLGLAALLDGRDPVDAPPVPPDAIPSRTGLLPYVPVVSVLVLVVVGQLDGRGLTVAEELAEHALVVLLLVRQYLSLRQNAALTARISADGRLLRHQAFHDALTGLPNRSLLRDRLEHARCLHERDRRPLGLLFIDLNDFKTVNDTLGHAAGDALLQGVANRLDALLRAGDTVARLGGDEFAVLLESGDDPHRCAERITEALRDPFPVADVQVHARASVGVVELGASDPAVSADELLARADAAMYTAKRAGPPSRGRTGSPAAEPFEDAGRPRNQLPGRADRGGRRGPR